MHILTHAEATERTGLIEVRGYEVELDLTTGPETFASSSTIRFAARPDSSTFVEIDAPRVRSARLNRRELDLATALDGDRIAVGGLAADNELTVVADCAYSHSGEGLHRFVDPADDEAYTYTQLFLYEAHRVFACFDQPDLKAPWTLRVTAPTAWTVLSNAAGRPVAPGRWAFDATPPVATYFAALAAGPYHSVTAVHDGIALGLHCRRSLAPFLEADELFDITRRSFDFYHALFGVRYPWGPYDQVFVPEFNAGAMENPGCVTFRDELVFRSRVTDDRRERRALIVAHELSHMWFGDLVTMRWWDDLWLNESFATWASVLAEAEATRWTESWTTFAVSEKLWALRQDQLPSTHPISADIRDLEDVEVNFDGITYAKGAAVLKQLVAWVGRDAFLQGVRAYFTEHAWGNTSLADLFTHLERTSGRDLSTWGEQWLQTAGVNTLTPHVAVDEDGAYTSVAIAQTADESHPTFRSHRIAIGLYDRTAADDGEPKLVRRDRIELDVTGEHTEVPQLSGIEQPDLLLLNDDDLTFAKIRLDERSRQTLVSDIGTLADPLPRALCWTASTDMLRDAELPTREYVELVLSGVERETDMSVVQTVLASAKNAIDRYADPADRLLLSSRWSSALHRMARDAEAGSDQQLAFTRAWAGSVASAEHIEELRALLNTTDGGDVLPGLAVDTDLRWTLLHRLVIVGAAGDGAIDDELERDNTATGRRQAAYARAARPSAEAKATAWAQAVESDELPNALLSATCSGFAHPEQRELVRPYVPLYLDAVPRVWAARTNESAQTIVVRLFPRILADMETAETVRSWLETAELPDAARRLVVEGLADIDRAVRAQACDREAGAHESIPSLP
ncbi:MAG TPA: aminopeptidase N [Jiangellaceae bacterium]